MKMSGVEEINGANGNEVSKKALKRQQKDAEMVAKKQQRQDDKQNTEASNPVEAIDSAVDQYGNFPLIQSQETLKYEFVDVKDINTEKKEQMIWLRARLQTSRGVGDQCFVVLKNEDHTIQALASPYFGNVSKQMIQFVSSVNKESLVEVECLVKIVDQKVESCTQQDVELHIKQFRVITPAAPRHPSLIEDASRAAGDEEFIGDQDNKSGVDQVLSPLRSNDRLECHRLKSNNVPLHERFRISYDELNLKKKNETFMYKFLPHKIKLFDYKNFECIEEMYGAQKEYWDEIRSGVLHSDATEQEYLYEWLRPKYKGGKDEDGNSFVKILNNFEAHKSLAPRSGVIVLNNKDEILFVEEATSRKFGLPKGRVELRETFAKCASREVQEELGLEISHEILEDCPTVVIKKELHVRNHNKTCLGAFYVVPLELFSNKTIKSELNQYEILSYC